MQIISNLGSNRIYLEYFREFLEGINKLIDSGISIIDVKKIRKINDIDASDRSIINFYWRFLELLKKKGYIARLDSLKPKKYRLLVYL